MSDYKELLDYIEQEAKKYGFENVRKRFFGSICSTGIFNEKIISFNRREIKKLTKYKDREAQKKIIDCIVKHEKAHHLHPSALYIVSKILLKQYEFETLDKICKENLDIIESQANVNAAAKLYDIYDELIDENAELCAYAIAEKADYNFSRIEKLEFKKQLNFHLEENFNTSFQYFNDKFRNKFVEKTLECLKDFIS